MSALAWLAAALLAAAILVAPPAHAQEATPTPAPPAAHSDPDASGSGGAVAEGQLVRASDGTLYLIHDGERHRVPVLAGLSDADIAAIPAGADANNGLAPLGDTLSAASSRTVGPWQVGLQSVQRPWTPPDGSSLVAPPGHEFVAVRVLARNAGTEPRDLNPATFRLQLADATQLAPSPAVLEAPLHLTTVLPGQAVAGEIAYAVPIGTPATALVYDPQIPEVAPIMLPLA